VFLITEKECYLLDSNGLKFKERFSFGDIQQICVSSLNDGLVVIRLPTDGPEGRGDLILETDKLVEFVIKLTLYANKMDKVEINSSGT